MTTTAGPSCPTCGSPTRTLRGYRLPQGYCRDTWHEPKAPDALPPDPPDLTELLREANAKWDLLPSLAKGKQSRAQFLGAALASHVAALLAENEKLRTALRQAIAGLTHDEWPERSEVLQRIDALFPEDA